MSKLVTFVIAGTGVLLVPVVAALALIGAAGTALTCTQVTGGLASTAPIPAEARVWVALTHIACPDLPEPWIAAVMDQDSRFRPTAHANDSNGGTWGLFQLTQQIWTHAYGAGWSADENHNGIWDIKEPAIHATIAGRYLCQRLAGVRAIRAAHPTWASTRDLTVLDELIIAHHAGESHLATYPHISAITAAFITTTDAHVASWTAPTPGTPMTTSPAPSVIAAARSPIATTATPPAPTPSLGAPVGPSAASMNTACASNLADVATVVVPPGTPWVVAQAVDRALKLVGTRSGFSGLCDHLACLTYGFQHSGYPSAINHWQVMLATGHARPGNRCPPLGSFLFWNASKFGHVSLVVQTDPTCNPNNIKVVSNDVLNNETGYVGAVYLVSLARIESGFVTRSEYLGWTDPICAGN